VSLVVQETIAWFDVIVILIIIVTIVAFFFSKLSGEDAVHCFFLFSPSPLFFVLVGTTGISVRRLVLRHGAVPGFLTENESNHRQDPMIGIFIFVVYELLCRYIYCYELVSNTNQEPLAKTGFYDGRPIDLGQG
jgi:hypothetical protein